MADLVSHPDEIKIVSKRFGKNAADIEAYLKLDGYKAVQKALTMSPDEIINEVKASEPSRTRRRRLPYRHEVELCPQGHQQSQIHPGQWR